MQSLKIEATKSSSEVDFNAEAVAHRIETARDCEKEIYGAAS